MNVVLPILAMFCSALVTLTAIVFCLAGGANSTPAQSRAIKLWMIGLTVLSATGLALGIVLLRAGEPGWSAISSIAPTAILGVIVVVALLK